MLSAIVASITLMAAGASWAAETTTAGATDEIKSAQGVEKGASGSAAPAGGAPDAATQGSERAAGGDAAAQVKGAEATTPDRAAQTAPGSAWPAGLELGLEVYHDRYAEPSVMTETGTMLGVTGAYTRPISPCSFRIEGRVAFGEVDYFSRTAGRLNGIPDVAVEVRALAGRDFRVGESTALTPYAGLATRYLWDDSKGRVSTNEYGGYRRESCYLYTPIGVSSLTPLGNDWSFGATVEYDLFWFGRQVSYRSDVSKVWPDAVNDQHEGIGWRGSLRFIKQLPRRSLVIEPFVRYWHIKTSDVSYGVEPDNRTVEAGLDVSVDF